MKTPKHWNFCLAMLSRVDPTGLGREFYAAEIGCASGGNAAFMLHAFPRLFLYMVDPWQAEPEYVVALKAARPDSPYLRKTTLDQATFDAWHDEAVAKTAFAADRRKILRMPSIVGATSIPDGSLSFCFIDGDHREESVATDLEAYWPKVRLGGIFAGHDYGTRGHDGVKRAVDAWAAKSGVQLELSADYPRCWLVGK